MSRAEKAIQAAASPESDESATAAVGMTGARIADPSPHPSSTGIAGSASALAGTRDGLDSWGPGTAGAEQRCELVTIIGEPGLGKSRLTMEAFDSLDAR